MDLNGVIKLVISILASFAAGGIGSLFTFKAIPTWYTGLKKPPYTPPKWAFGPVWTILYILMGISVFLIWQNGIATDRFFPGFGVGGSTSCSLHHLGQHRFIPEHWGLAAEQA
jgi:tryptophan-rich sensory protein